MDTNVKSTQTMSGNDYQKAAARTATQKCLEFSNIGLGIAGESGKVANLIKKHVYHNCPLDREKLAEKLGDVLWYVAIGAMSIGYTLEDIMNMNIEKLKVLYPDGFDSNTPSVRTGMNVKIECTEKLKQLIIDELTSRRACLLLDSPCLHNDCGQCLRDNVEWTVVG